MSGQRLPFRFRWELALRADTRGLPLNYLGVLLVMATWASSDTGENVRPSQSRLAKALGCSEDTVNRAVAASVSAGWLTVSEDNRARRKPNVYRLSIPRDSLPAGERVVIDSLPAGERVALPAGERVNPVGIPTGDPVANSATGLGQLREGERRRIDAEIKAFMARDGG